MVGYRHQHALVLIFLVSPLLSHAADPPMVTGVRLGVHRDFTRVVVDFKGQEAPYSVRLADDGLSLQIIAKAGGADGTLPPKRLGLIRDVQWRSVTNGLVVTVAAGTPVSVKGKGSLAPDASSRSYRIYVDLMPGTAPEPPPPVESRANDPAPVGDPSPPAKPEPEPSAPQPQMSDPSLNLR